MLRRSFLQTAGILLLSAMPFMARVAKAGGRRRRRPDNPIDGRAQAIADDLQDTPDFVGFEPTVLLGLLSVLLPMLLKCFMGTPAAPTAAELKAAAAKVWNEDRQEYDPKVMQRGRVQAKKQARKHGELLTNEQADAITHTSLDHLRLGKDPELQAFSQACWASPIPAAKED